MEIITEHEEQKQKEKGSVNEERKALAASLDTSSECWKLAQLEAGKKAGDRPKHAANQVTENQEERSQNGDDDNNR